MSATPPGWYDDTRGSLRWWDGATWTEHVHAPGAAPEVAASEVAASDGAAFDASHAPDSPRASAADPLGALAAGYPGAATSQAPRRRSRWWIWVAAGAAVLIVLIVLAVIFLPLAFRAILGGSGGSSADKEAATQAVQEYDRAWQSENCDLMFSVTTDDFRESYDFADCATFEQQAGDLADTTDDYEVAVTSVSSGEDGTVTVETSETYTSRFDEEGEDTGTVTPYTDDYTYVVVPSEGTWLIDDAALE